MTVRKGFSAEIKALNDVFSALEGLETADQMWVLETAASRLGVTLRGISGVPTSSSPRTAFGTGVTISESEMTPKDFIRSKDPKSDVQWVACLAYYLTRFRETPHFKSRELSALNTEAAGPRINISRAVNNATNQNWYLTAAGGGRKQITTVGEDVVRALPDQEAVKLAEQNGRRVRKKSARKEK